MNNDRQRQNIIARAVPAQTVLALVAVAAAHDQGTDEHAHRMMRSADATARELACTDEDVNILQLAALFHDIGKIGVPDAILHKPEPLNEEEWKIMRLHPQIGARILEQTGGIFRTLAPIVVAHHERWDGNGYPFNLAGEQIPLASRILTVVDAYDAMISRRPYHEPVNRKQAEQELLRCSGTQFDPRIVDAFLRMLSKHEEQMSVNDAQPVLA
jgi:putative nucleotidyltransferase with HDIG domain